MNLCCICANVGINDDSGSLYRAHPGGDKMLSATEEEEAEMELGSVSSLATKDDSLQRLMVRENVCILLVCYSMHEQI